MPSPLQIPWIHQGWTSAIDTDIGRDIDTDTDIGRDTDTETDTDIGIATDRHRRISACAFVSHRNLSPCLTIEYDFKSDCDRRYSCIYLHFYFVLFFLPHTPTFFLSSLSPFRALAPPLFAGTLAAMPSPSSLWPENATPSSLLKGGFGGCSLRG